MIQPFEIRWRNFRSFRDTGWIRVKPITIVIGANNSGKTSLHAPLLLLKQTLTSDDPRAGLVTSGAFTDVGSFEDAVFCHNAESRISFDLRWEQESLNVKSRKPRPLGDDRPGAAAWSFQNGTEASDVELASTHIFDVHHRTVLARRRQKSGRYSIANLPSPGSDKGRSIEVRAMLKAMRDAQPYGFLFAEETVEQAGVMARAHSRKGEDEAFFQLPTSKRLQLYQAIVSYAWYAVSGFLSEVYYLGPVRRRLQRFYELTGERPADVGVTGEHAPHLIYRWRHDKAKMNLLDHWLRAFGFDQTLQCLPQGDYAFSLLLRAGRTAPATGFVDLGFGVSQVLPLIVQAMSSDRGDLVLAEQPEIHLNPALQATLADLFTYFYTEQGVWSFIETHSEHLLLRLRRLVAEGTVSSDDVAVLYVEKKGRESTVREVPILPDGTIEPQEWPEGFFGQSLVDSLALAKSQLRRST